MEIGVVLPVGLAWIAAAGAAAVAVAAMVGVFEAVFDLEAP